MLPTITQPIMTPHAVSVRRKWDSRSYYGASAYGKTRYESNDGFPGIYQQRKCKEGKLTILMKFYEPTNPQTVIQQANRTKLANGVIAWQSLTDNQKAIYNNRAKGKPLTGYNLFIKEYMIS